MYSNFEMTYNSYLMHHGTKGMKWGVRRTIARQTHLPGSWGRAVMTARQHDLDVKNRWTVAKNKAKAGVLDKKSQEYREARAARINNITSRGVSYLSGFGDGSRGRYMQHIANGKSHVEAYVRVYTRRALTGAAAGLVLGVGANFVQALANRRR